jgi:hypothetical protein
MPKEIRDFLDKAKKEYSYISFEQSLKETTKAETPQAEKIAELEAARDMEVEETPKQQSDRIKKEIDDLLGEDAAGEIATDNTKVGKAKRKSIRAAVRLKIVNEKLKELVNCI